MGEWLYHVENAGPGPSIIHQKIELKGLFIYPENFVCSFLIQDLNIERSTGQNGLGRFAVDQVESFVPFISRDIFISYHM